MAGAYETDFRAHPEAYRYDSSEKGVFKVQPYKDELLPDWGFKDEAAAEASVEALRARYETYRSQDDFVGMDMVRKYLRMGFTRAMRYAKYSGGRKYEDDGTKRDPEQWAAPEKRAAAVVFRDAWRALTDDPAYQCLKEHHQNEVYAPDASPMAE
ncbi:DUF4385 family protein [Salinibacter altiplanensis]|uniref:DUF4385 family protein n=1 Tax=Salinibacter altiplanensis TaxID=1803181 RepID=UPI000C9FBB0E|nr:DUF4385 family protein [Salinibacter altiplanensis]